MQKEHKIFILQDIKMKCNKVTETYKQNRVQSKSNTFFYNVSLFSFKLTLLSHDIISI